MSQSTGTHVVQLRAIDTPAQHCLVSFFHLRVACTVRMEFSLCF
ncbi:hypothetical protein AAE485_03170 [Acidithiobacillus ferriphilus]|jgi:hypothetical protein|nr:MULTISPECIES: hypothetical protein [Acidithiobacillus]MDA8180801.1 hypothetical protein [Acidithiobacillus sp.]MDA8245140.1 hypothetical protein [Acidithiobacillus sp.]MEB8476009.1 hypothetical protein [Acidithiobacillus ferriphilus]MEB8520955.1 hypothetical protein [Acidithiobacillus ferriphilus]WCE94101.1 hypothetical protein PJU76_00750 [Acidithiobacillus ferriphilus]